MILSNSNENIILDLKNFLSFVVPEAEKTINKLKNSELSYRSIAKEQKSFNEDIYVLQKIVENSSPLSSKVALLMESGTKIEGDLIELINDYVDDSNVELQALSNTIEDYNSKCSSHSLVTGYNYKNILKDFNSFVDIADKALVLISEEISDELTTREIEDCSYFLNALNNEIVQFKELSLELETLMLLDGVEL